MYVSIRVGVGVRDTLANGLGGDAEAALAYRTELASLVADTPLQLWEDIPCVESAVCL